MLSSRLLARCKDSCLGDPLTDPLTVLADALSNDNLRVFVDAVNSLEDDDEDVVNQEMGASQGFSTVLHLTVASGKEDFVRELLRHPRVNPNLSHRTSKRFPIHVAAYDASVGIINALLHAGADVNARTEDGSTALHVLALRSAANFMAKDTEVEVTTKKRKDFADSVSLILRQLEARFDLMNNIAVTPLYFAVNSGTEEVARLLIEAGASVDLEVDGEDTKGTKKTLETLLKKKMPTLHSSVDQKRKRKWKGGSTEENKLFHLLYHDEVRFLTKLEERQNKDCKTVDLDADDGGYTFLQFACDQGMDRVVGRLLKKGAKPNKCCESNKTPPLVLAGHHGYHKILKIFKDHIPSNKGRHYQVDFAASDGIRGDNVLHKVLKAESMAHASYDHRDYDLCTALLLDPHPSMRRLMCRTVTAPDIFSNTPLHIAAECGRLAAVRLLLHCGGNVNIGSKNARGTTPIEKIPADLMEEFLDECLRAEGMPVDEDFLLAFDYAFLAPPMVSSWCESDEPINLAEEANREERQQPLPEAEPLWYLSQSPRHRPLLTHPVISSFLCLKWRRMRPYFYINLTCYLIFVALLTSYLLILQDSSKARGMAGGILWALATFSLSILAARELFQAMVSSRYIFNLENLLELTLVAVTASVLALDDYDNFTVRCLSGSALLLSWAEMVLLIGRHPKLSTYLAMFSKVSTNFFFFLTWYVLFIVAFGLAFFVVLRRDVVEKEDKGAHSNNRSKETEPQNEYYATPDKALFKTVVMSLTGEIEFEGIDFNGSFFAIGLFLLYVFFILLVLVNLLNGLAVSDITEIQKYAEIVSHASRVEFISYMESMLLGDPTGFLTNKPLVKLLCQLPSCSCLSAFYSLGPVRRVFDAIMRSTKLFTSRIRGKVAEFEPNRSARCSALRSPSLPGQEEDQRDQQRDSSLMLDGRILQMATDLVVKRRQREAEAAVSTTNSRKLDKMEKALKLLAKQNNLIIKLLQHKK